MMHEISVFTKFEISSLCFQVQESVGLLLSITDVHCWAISICLQVQEGVDLLLYNLLVLGCITDVHGHVWRRSLSDFYLVEAMPLLEHTESQVGRPESLCFISI